MKHTHLTIREISQRWNDEIRQGLPLSMELIGDLLDDFGNVGRRSLKDGTGC